MPRKEPRYLTIYNDLKQQILSGKLQPDDQLPTELQLAHSYQVSRITSKRALTELESRDLIYRQQGSGSFVQRHESANSSKQLLVVLPFPTDAGLGDYASGISAAANTRHYQAVTMDPRGFAQLSPTEIKHNYAGIIYLPQDLYQEAEQLYLLKLEKVPLVLLDKSLPELELPVVAADNFNGGQLATEHLIKLHHQQILFYAQNPQAVLPSSVYERYFGYLRALHQAALKPVASIHELAALNQLTPSAWLDYLQKHHISAIVVENDLIAIKLMNRLRAVDATIWQRLSIIGFDNIQAASLTYPALTTMAQDFKGMGKKAVELLLNPPAKPKIERLPVKLIKRASTRPFTSKEEKLS
ncbi:LacI family DNA-binding transcriptional regulator [Lactiplantibacillus sp. WILCCON 0030]|uniref:LacI family DNA-binding transcriptional regulator n=1 Tax=Lactiplantibacillus brownii TaxID=3069269 RepID=A0ABU1ACP5_9LACO|nr:LacI family DNA-binding transcriptional regulator [Lactiplantibacillus brownii]MDQ7938689.1 LacI family DNA-binding transcriptional regulator [Lactiplantibacillus brownii]